MPYPVRRTIGIMLFTGLVAAVATLFIEDKNYIRYALAGYYGMGGVCLLGLLSGVKIVKQFYLVHDIVCGHLIFIPLFLLAALQLPGLIQTWLLYHNALSTDVVVSDILRYARRTQESGSGGENNEDMMEQITELRKQVQKQEHILASAGLTSGDMALSSSISSGSVADLITASPRQPVLRSQSTSANSSGMPAGRAFSMSGLDVWGNMALGDVQNDDMRQGPSSSGIPADAGTGTMAPVKHPSPKGFSFTQPDTMPPR